MNTTAATKEPLVDFIWMEHLPRFEIISTKTINRNCYCEVHYQVRSSAKLSEDDFEWLRSKGYFLNGQVFLILPKEHDQKVSGRWTVDGKSWVPFYEYQIRCAVDSSD